MLIKNYFFVFFKPVNAFIILYRTTATASFNRDSPNTRKYKSGFTPTLNNINQGLLQP